MLEVPSLAEMLDQLLPRVDFISVGTNDLTQFLFAADRSDPRLAQRYDWLSPAILRFLKRVLDQARAGEFRSASAAKWRAAARGDGADRARRREFLDHPGGGGTGEGDGPLARRRGDPRRAWASSWPSRPGTCARRSATGRGDIRWWWARLRLTLAPQPSNSAYAQARS